MLTLETLDAALVARVLQPTEFSMARALVERVQLPTRRGPTLTGIIHDGLPCEIEVTVKSDGFLSLCTCSNHRRGMCRHVGALLLRWVQMPSSFRDEPSLSGEPVPGYPVDAVALDPPATSRPNEPPAWLAQPFSERRKARLEQLAGTLQMRKTDELREIAVRHGFSLKGTRKADIARQLAEHLADPAFVRPTLDGLDAEHRQVLAAVALAQAGGIAQTETIDALSRQFGKLKMYRQVSVYLRHLVEAGLIAEVSMTITQSQGFYLPSAVMPALLSSTPLLQGLVPAVDVPPPAPAAGLHLADPYALVQSALLLTDRLEEQQTPRRAPQPRPRREASLPQLQGWAYDAAELAEASQQGRLRMRSDLYLTVPPPDLPLSDEAMARLAPANGGTERLEFLLALLVAAGLVQPGSPLTVWSEVKSQFTRLSEPARRAALVRSYLAMADWSELWSLLRAPGGPRLGRNWSDGRLTPTQLLADLLALRHVVLNVLTLLPDGLWIKPADLQPLFRAIWPRFNRPGSQRFYGPDSWLLSGPGRPLQPGPPVDWQAGQSRFIEQVIAGPLHWLGLADVLFKGDRLAAFRLLGLADLYHDRVETPVSPRPAAFPAAAPPKAGRIRPVEVDIGEDLRLAARPSALDATMHAFLERIARLEVADRDRFVYCLDPQATRRAFEAGATPDSLAHDWQHLLGRPLPEPFRVQITHWWAGYGQVRITHGLAVLELSDDYALAEIRAVTSLDRFLVAEVSPRLAIVTREGVDVLRAELEKAGYSPKLTDQV